MEDQRTGRKCVMGKVFNVTADCKPQLHSMVDISGRVEEIAHLVDKGEYFTINRARQYGKTTTLPAVIMPRCVR